MLPSKMVRRLAILPVAFVACTSSEGMSPVDGGATGGATSSSSASSASSSTSGATTGGAGGHGGASSSSSTGGTGGSTSTGGAGGASSSSSVTSSGSGGASSSSASSASSSASSGAGGTGGAAGTHVRFVAGNLTSGNAQSYDPGHGKRILQGVHADLLLIQEANYLSNSTIDLRAFVDAVCGIECVYNRGSGAIPNAVISRYPIVASGTWVDPKVTNRDFTWARIDVPGAVDLWAVSVHLLTSNPTDRDTEAASLIGFLQANVPAGDHVVVGGDFNTDVRTEAAITTLTAVFSTAAPYPADANGNSNTSGPRTRPYDWVLASPALRALETPVVIGAAHFDAGLVVDTRIYTPIADLAPALVGDSGATGMQHMAVVRDFLLP